MQDFNEQTTETDELLLSKLPIFERNVMVCITQKSLPFENTLNNKYSSLLADSSLENIVNLIAKLSMEIRLQIFKKVFADMSTEIAKQTIKQNPNFLTNHSFTYGDIEFASFVNILQRCDIKSGTVFVDLGHGTGRALIAASIAYDSVFSKIHGIELLSELVTISKERVTQYNNIIQSDSFNAFYSRKLTNNVSLDNGDYSHSSSVGLQCPISIEEGDFLSENSSSVYDWTQADLVFANSTCFGLELMQQLAIRAERMRSGSKVVTLTHRLPSTSFEVVDQRQYCMSWGAATCYIHKRL